MPMDEPKQFPTVKLDRNATVPANSKIYNSRWIKLGQEGKDLAPLPKGFVREGNNIRIKTIDDTIKEKVKPFADKYVAPISDKINSGIEAVKEWADKPLLPEIKPYDQNENMWMNEELGIPEAPFIVGLKTFGDEFTQRLYNKIFRPMSTPKNAALGVGMAVAPEAAAPYIAATFAGVQGKAAYDSYKAAEKETDPTKKRELYFDAMLNAGFATLAGTPAGAKLIKDVGEMPVMKAVGESIKKSQLMTDESGFLTLDFLNTVDRHMKWSEGSLPDKTKLLESGHTQPGTVSTFGKPKDVLDLARQTSNEITKSYVKGRTDLEGWNPQPYVTIGKRTGGVENVILDPKAKSTYDLTFKRVTAKPNMESLGHEVGHWKTTVDAGQMTPAVADSLVKQYINDQFGGSRRLESIGEGIWKDYHNPNVTNKSVGYPEMSIQGRYRQELIAEAWAWKNAVDKYGIEYAKENWNPQSVVGYTLSYGSHGRARLVQEAARQKELNKIKSEEKSLRELKKKVKATPEDKFDRGFTKREGIEDLNHEIDIRKLQREAVQSEELRDYTPSQLSAGLPEPPVSKVFGQVSDQTHLPAEFNKTTKQWEGPGAEHLQGFHLRPDLTDVKVVNRSINPESGLLAFGKDSKGRSQYIYKPEFLKQNADAKFARVKELSDSFDKISRKINKDIKAGSEEAAALNLVLKTGLRPGSTRNTLADVQAYGATTLKGQHVIGDSPKNVRLVFTGKKGVDLDIPVKDTTLARDLIQRRNSAGPDGDIFKIDAKKLGQYTKSLGEGGFKTKDFRTALGTRTATELIQKMDPPKTMSEYKAKVREVGDAVSQRLGNTRLVALQSYINPSVFAEWLSNLKGE